jgi:hypothetical protein
MTAVDTVRWPGIFVATPGVASHLLLGWAGRIGPQQWSNISATVDGVADTITVVNQGFTGSHLLATLTATTTAKGGGPVIYTVFLASSVSPIP